MLVQWPEVSFDACDVADANLDVILLGKSGVLIETLALHKRGSSGVERFVACFLASRMKKSNDSTIELPEEQVRTR